MSFSLHLAQYFFWTQYRRQASAMEELWSHYGIEALSGCRLWDSRDSFIGKASTSSIKVDRIDWAQFVQNQREGTLQRQIFGQFFSPSSAIAHTLSHTPLHLRNYLDPSCGVGCFLLHLWTLLSARGDSTEEIASKLYGVDLDPDLVAISRFRLFQQSGWRKDIGTIVQRNIQIGDALLYPKNKIVPPRSLHPINWCSRFPEINSAGGFEGIIGNPPFLFLSGRGSPVRKLRADGLLFEADTLQQRITLYKQLHPEAAVGCADLYKYFVHVCTEQLSPNGFLSLILPSSWIRLSRYENTRQRLLEHRLYRIDEFEQSHFPKLVVPSSIVFCGDSKSKITYHNHQTAFQCILERRSPFSIYTNEVTETIYSAKHLTLDAICTIHEGLHDYRSRDNETQMIGNFETAKLRAFHPPPVQFVQLPRRFPIQQHSGQRILLRKTGDKLIGALIRDPQCCLTHQNCYVIHPKGKFSPYLLEYLLNSPVLSYLYQHGPAGQRGRVMAQFRIWALRKLPLPEKLKIPEVQQALLEAYLSGKGEEELIGLYDIGAERTLALTEAISSRHLVYPSDDPN